MVLYRRKYKRWVGKELENHQEKQNEMKIMAIILDACQEIILQILKSRTLSIMKDIMKSFA